MNNIDFAIKLAETIKENPTLEVMCKVDSDIVAEDGYAWWLGYLNPKLGIDIDEYSTDIGENVKFKSDEDWSDWYEELGLDFDDIETDDELMDAVDEAANWKKAIFISITT